MTMTQSRSCHDGALVLDQLGQAVFNIAPAGLDLLDPLQDGDGLGRETIARFLVGEGHQHGNGVSFPTGHHVDIRELQP